MFPSSKSFFLTSQHRIHNFLKFFLGLFFFLMQLNAINLKSPLQPKWKAYSLKDAFVQPAVLS